MVGCACPPQPSLEVTALPSPSYLHVSLPTATAGNDHSRVVLTGNGAGEEAGAGEAAGAGGEAEVRAGGEAGAGEGAGTGPGAGPGEGAGPGSGGPGGDSGGGLCFSGS